MSSYLNINLSQFNPEGKFEFPGKYLNQSEKRIYGEILRIHRSLISDYLCNRRKYIFSYNRFLVYGKTLINLKREIYSIKVFTFKYIENLNAVFSAECRKSWV